MNNINEKIEQFEQDIENLYTRTNNVVGNHDSLNKGLNGLRDVLTQLDERLRKLEQNSKAA
jgi:ABC-type transporter Mla subunit MlaD